MENQKKTENLEARERNKFLGQEGPILVDGIKTGQKTKGNGKLKVMANNNRSIFSPGPMESGDENLEDKISVVNPSSSSKGDSNSQSILEVSAGEHSNRIGTETDVILDTMAWPLNKRPFPPVDRRKNELPTTTTMDIDLMAQGYDQGKSKEPGKDVGQLELSKISGSKEKLSEDLNLDLGLASSAPGGKEKFKEPGKDQMQTALSGVDGNGGKLDETLSPDFKFPDSAGKKLEDEIPGFASLFGMEVGIKKPGLAELESVCGAIGASRIAHEGPAADELGKPGSEDTGGINGQLKVRG